MKSSINQILKLSGKCHQPTMLSEEKISQNEDEIEER
jgi:hypothetical protein